MDDEGNEIEGEERMLRDEVLADDIAAVVATWTGIPPQKLLETERERILTMGEKLKERVVGQDEAVGVVTEAIQRSRAGLNDPSKPIASLIFLYVRRFVVVVADSCSLYVKREAFPLQLSLT
jgi:ATP-dependent Clp protease ATP-binding subunit ClpB